MNSGELDFMMCSGLYVIVHRMYVTITQLLPSFELLRSSFPTPTYIEHPEEIGCGNLRSDFYKENICCYLVLPSSPTPSIVCLYLGDEEIS